ncbi:MULTISPECIES: hypothetical protein [unclassified Streptomyces]|uniref:hypothetical protein n=1 Tax=unclassified Streptomyces TaxID=2593676 RepID=UPI001F1B7269|nr:MULTISPECIES: hypothetical protein [unclassified Streptomyces]
MNKFSMTSKMCNAVVGMIILCSIISGCSDMNENGGDAPVRVSSEVQDEVEGVSSSILNILSLKAKTTEAGAMVTSCEGGNYRAHHPWSLYGASSEELGNAMGKLRSQLPAKGWEIVKDGPDDTQARNAQIIADSPGGDFSLNARLHEERNGNPAQLEVTVQSACFRPESTATS